LHSIIICLIFVKEIKNTMNTTSNNKSMLHQIDGMQNSKMDTMIEMNFHHFHINKIKRDLGKQCTYLSHESRPSYSDDAETGKRVKSTKHFIKAIMINETKGKDTVTYEIDGMPKTLTESDYINLYNKLKDNVYAGQK